MEVPAVNLKAIVLVHWLLMTWGCMEWLPSSYAWGNFTILAVGVWAMTQRDSVDAILMFLTRLLLTILTDIVHINLFYPALTSLSDALRFSTGMAIFNLLLKPLSCFFAYQMYREHGGEYAFNLGFLSVGQDQSSYKSIDLKRPLLVPQAYLHPILLTQLLRRTMGGRPGLWTWTPYLLPTGNSRNQSDLQSRETKSTVH